MLVWVIKDGENLPVQGDVRRMRTWMLGEAFASQGHEVVWWASTFSHQRKTELFRTDHESVVSPGFLLRLLAAGKYQRNISLRRYLHHRRLGQRFWQVAHEVDPPDAIVCSFPVIDLAYQAVRFALEKEIRIVVDVRDFWPDLYLERLPRIARGPARLLLLADFNRARFIFQHASALTGISQGILDWSLRYAGRQQQPWDRVFYTGYPDDPSVLDSRVHPIPPYLRPHTNKRLFTFVGSFGSSYDLTTVCRAARRFHEHGIDGIHFTIAGSGDQAEEITRATRDLPNVTLPGWLGAQQIKALLAHSDVGIIPCRSVKDSMPNKIYEYLSAGLPVLSSLEGEFESILQEHRIGYSYRCGDVDGLCSGIQRMLDSWIDQRPMSQRARRLFETQFRASDIYSSYVQHVENLSGFAAPWRRAA